MEKVDQRHTPPERLSDNLTAEQIEQWMEGARDPNGHPGWHPATNRDIHDLCELALRAIRSESAHRNSGFAAIDPSGFFVGIWRDRETAEIVAAKHPKCAVVEMAAASSEDGGTAKLLTDLLDRGYKMHVMAGTTTRLSEQSGEQNDPLLAWLSDVRSVLYGKTKPTPEISHVGR